MWVKIKGGSHREQVGDSTILHTPTKNPIFRLSLENYKKHGGSRKFQIISLDRSKPEPDENGNYPDIQIDPETGKKLEGG